MEYEQKKSAFDDIDSNDLAALFFAEKITLQQ